jgi:hypothetical protein
MRRFMVVTLVLAVLVTACESSTISEPTSTAGRDTSTTHPEPEIGLDRIVVSTVTGAIAVYDETGDEISRIDPPEGHIFRQPTWLDDSTVVFSDVSDSGNHSLTAADAETGRVVWRAEMETPPFYFSPAPAGSTFATTTLRNDPSGAGLISELVGHLGEVTPLSSESPFYTSWSPEGESLAVHIPGGRLDVRRTGGTETILSDTGLFQTPVWLDRGLVTLRSVEGIQRLALWSDGTFTDIAEVEGPVGFVASGDMIAIQATERPDAGSIAAGLRAQLLPAVPGGKLVVIDLEAGTQQTVSSELALLFQWNQSGEALLYATLGDEPLSLAWNVWSDGRSVEIKSFTLQPPWFRNLVPFFDQYAQSVQFWSLSGEYIGYPAVLDADAVVVIDSVDGTEFVVIPGATWIAWAPSG